MMFGKGLAYSHLDNETQIILGTAYLENGVTNARMQSIINRDSTKIGHMLADLVEQQMLIAEKKDVGHHIDYMGHTGYSTTENVNNIKIVHLHWGLQLIFDESQKETSYEKSSLN